MKKTGNPGVFYSEESSELKTGNHKKTVELFLPRVIDILIFKLPKERYLMKIRMLQSEIQRLKIQTMIEISENLISPSVTLFEKGSHNERTGSVSYPHKCAKMVATKKNFILHRINFCFSIGSELFFY